MPLIESTVMPRRPSSAARRGTAFHAWVEHRFESRPLFVIVAEAVHRFAADGAFLQELRPAIEAALKVGQGRIDIYPVDDAAAGKPARAARKNAESRVLRLMTPPTVARRRCSPARARCG